MLKKIIRGVVSLVLLTSLLTTGTYVSAKTPTPTEEQLNKYMEHANYPKEIIDMFELPQKQRIYEEKAVYAYHKHIDGDLKESQDQESQNSASGDVNAQTFYNWGSTLTASYVSQPSAPGKVEFILDYNFDWNYKPYYTLEDKFGLAWTDDFDPYPETARYAYRAFGSNGNAGYAEYATGAQYTYDTYSPGTGIGWVYDSISSFYQNGVKYDVYRHKGWGQVKIGKYSDKSGAQEQTSAVGTYFHKEGTFTGALTFSKTPEVQISYSISYDKAPDAGTTFTWTKYAY
ncbi:hypothetical protein [Effusibacillus consociatus]|uniref:Uncharacterized protein n=1 Tax=Effusibacillus consociatus TaxID=1117041 RepID=A0ABV9Q0T9_9BACL